MAVELFHFKSTPPRIFANELSRNPSPHPGGHVPDQYGKYSIGLPVRYA
jgi:hypothetical protein